MLHLVLATRNPHKTREFTRILGPGFEISDLLLIRKVPAVDETGLSFEANAVLKAVTASRRVSGLVVADDSGLEVPALGGAPGVYSARYAGKNATDADNIAKLLAALNDIPNGREARFRCVIALAQDGDAISTFDGQIEGRITTSPSGVGGFGYDPVFVPAGFEQTFADLGEETKNRISHRAAAITKLREFLSRQ